MKKIMKRLLTGVLTLATVFTALPVTQVHAADSVYTTTDAKAGTIVKIDNGGLEVSSFEESIMNADGQIAYCIDINTNFQSGYKNRINATERMSDDQISDVALNLEYVKQYAEKHSLSSKQVYLLEQCVVWRRLSVHLGWGYNNVRAAYDEVSEKIQSEVYENAKAFAKENKDRYDCGGYIYVGEGQDLGQFWAKLAVGDGKIQKSSSNTAITKSNEQDRYGMGNTLYIGSLKSEVYFCIYEKDYEQYVKYDIPIEDTKIKNRFEIRLKNERAYYAVRDLLTYHDAERTAFDIINRYMRFADKEVEKRRSEWKTNEKWAYFIGSDRGRLKLTTKPEPYTLTRTLNWISRQVAPTWKVLQQIDSTNGTTYLKDILDHAKLTERHKKLIEQQTTSTEEIINKEE